MKTAISIPDDVFRSAEQFARQTCQSRSKLYTTAVNDYLKRRRDDHITQRLNEVYNDVDSSLDPVIQSLQAQAIPKEEW